jgi:hypothetical protein
MDAARRHEKLACGDSRSHRNFVAAHPAHRGSIASLTSDGRYVDGTVRIVKALKRATKTRLLHRWATAVKDRRHD